MDETFAYDEGAAVEFIHKNLPQELKAKFSDDTLYYILDLICEFYEENDYLTEDIDEEKEERELIAFIVQQAKKDKIGDFLPEDILLVLRAESAYMDTLDIEEFE